MADDNSPQDDQPKKKGRPKLPPDQREANKQASADKKKAMREARLKAGKCFFCGKDNNTGTVRCQKCLDKHNARQNARSQAAVANKLCTTCQAELPSGYDGTRCETCAAKHADAGKRYRSRRKDKPEESDG